MLAAYRTSLENFLQANNINFLQKDYSYILDNSKNPPAYNSKAYTKKADTQIHLKLAEKIFDKIKTTSVPQQFCDLCAEQICLLPLISWLRFYDNKKKEDFGFYLQKAADYFKKYLGRN